MPLDQKLEASRRQSLWREAKLEQDFADEVERYKRVLAEGRNLFDIDEILHYAERPHKLVLTEFPDLVGASVFWCPLNTRERREVFKIKHADVNIQRDLQNRKTVFFSLKKANPDQNITEEMIDGWPNFIIDRIMLELNSLENRFLLRPMTKDLDGLVKALGRKEKS